MVLSLAKCCLELSLIEFRIKKKCSFELANSGSNTWELNKIYYISVICINLEISIWRYILYPAYQAPWGIILSIFLFQIPHLTTFPTFWIPLSSISSRSVHKARIKNLFLFILVSFHSDIYNTPVVYVHYFGRLYSLFLLVVWGSQFLLLLLYYNVFRLFGNFHQCCGSFSEFSVNICFCSQ